MDVVGDFVGRDVVGDCDGVALGDLDGLAKLVSAVGGRVGDHVGGASVGDFDCVVG